MSKTSKTHDGCHVSRSPVQAIYKGHVRVLRCIGNHEQLIVQDVLDSAENLQLKMPRIQGQDCQSPFSPACYSGSNIARELRIEAALGW